VSYRIALKRLLAYEPKKLIVGWYQNDYGCCVIGAILTSSHRHNAKDVDAILNDQVCYSEIQAMGLTDEEVTSMLDRNDSLRGDSDQARYAHMVEWLQAQDTETLSTLGSREIADAR
jgi:hypothetical protein